jgi:RHS repeat-associated protein
MDVYQMKTRRLAKAASLRYQLSQLRSSNLTYDLNGNLAGDGTNTYTWDARNHLVSISGGVSASFQYDPFGRRVGKTIGAATTNYLYDGVNTVQELSAGSPTANLLTGLHVDEYFQRIDSSGVANFLTDALWNTIALTGPAGNTFAQYTYDPFGSMTMTGSSLNPYQYTGRENDGTGLYYYRARYYYPSSGRFISEDPSRFASGSVDFYAYVENNPARYVDPFGLSRKDVAKLQAFFQNAINQMTSAGARTDPGWWNNIVATFGRAYLGCADQTQVVNDQYVSDRPGLALDDNWNFQTHTSHGGAHTYAVLQSPNPTDPDLLVDPLNNIVEPVPKGTK